jgi:hypothetical protein
MANLRGGINRNENLHASISGAQSLNGRLNVGGSTKDYNKLDNKPQINGIELIGDITLEQLKAQSIFQYSEMPEANEDYLGKIVQYIGETDENYTNGYFYKCEEESGSYFWTNIQIQDDEELEVPIYVITGDTQENIDKFNKCWQLFLDNKPFTAYYRSTEDNYIKYVPLIFEKHASVENIYSCTFIGWTGLSSQGLLLSIGYIQGIQGNVGEYTAIRITDSSSMKRQIPYIYYGDNDSGQGKVLTTKNVFAYTPTADYHPAVLKTVNDAVAKKQDIMQYKTLPTASEDNEGQIVQYIGTTDGTYTQGYFYQVVSDGEATPTYSWENIEIQASSTSGGSTYFLTTPFTTATASTSLNADDIATLNKAIDDFRAGKDFVLIAKKMMFKISGSTTSYNYNVNGIMRESGRYIYIDFYRNFGTGTSVWPINFDDASLIRTMTLRDVGTPANITSASLPAQGTPNFGDNVITIGNTVAYNVNNDYNPAHKKYVDDSISNAIGNINTILATLTTPSNGGGE